MKDVRTRSKGPTHAISPGPGPGSREAASEGASNAFMRYLRILGPGLIVGASDDDPSGIATYAVAGAMYGFSTLWMAIVTFPMMASVQYIASKVGLVTGEGFAGVLRRHYPPWLVSVVAFSLFAANTINAGADIGAIAAAINLILPHVPAAALVIPVGAALLAVQTWGSYRMIASTFKWLTLVLLAYIAAGFLAHPHWPDVARGTFIPKIELNADYLTTLVAILGTTISPYMIFWQASQEVEEDIALGRTKLSQRRGSTKRELRFAAVDVGSGMLLSNIVMYFIILATAATLFVSGQRHVETATDVAKALVPFAGPAAEWLLAIGLIGAGALAVPVLTTSSAYALAGAFAWKQGLDEKLQRAPKFYGIIAISTVVGMEINFLGISPVAALFWTAVINGLLAPLVLVVLMLVATNRKIMGKFVNGFTVNVLGWGTTAAMALAAVVLLLSFGH